MGKIHSFIEDEIKNFTFMNMNEILNIAELEYKKF